MQDFAPAYVLLGLILRSANLVAIKAAMKLGFQPFSFGLLRFHGITFLLLPWLVWSGRRILPPDPRARRALFTEGVLKGFGAACFYLALDRLPASAVLLVSFSGPVVMLILARIYLEASIPWGRWLGIGIGVSALAHLVVARQEILPELSAEASLEGLLLTFTGVLFTTHMILAQKRTYRFGGTPLESLLWSNGISGVFWIAPAFFLEGFPRTLPSEPFAWGVLLYAITLGGMVHFLYQRWLVSWLRASYLAAYSPLSHFLGIGLSAWFLEESMGLLFWKTLAGILVASTLAARGPARDETWAESRPPGEASPKVP